MAKRSERPGGDALATSAAASVMTLPRPALSPELRAVMDFSAGGVMGVLGAVVTYPLDVAKTYVQTGVVRGGLFGGLPQHLMVTCGQQCIKFGVFETLQRARGAQTKQQATASTAQRAATALTSGAVAGVTQGLILTPIERMKTFRQVNGAGLRLSVGAGAGFWSQGMLAVCMRDSLFSMTLFATNIAAKDVCESLGVSSGVGFTLAAVLSGGLAATLVTPLDMARAVQQSAIEKVSFRDAASAVFQKHGYFGFWRGGGLRFARFGSQYFVTFAGLALIQDFVGQPAEEV
uniref:Mitochondrial carrier protein n=2 Tax=Phaeomonas parva TaxID=124430 RepID=A0A7S1TY61_9STRA|mmetsp:Transcript_22493/g.69687  ORF Transcript_22493/g.69687 Transcript_22493/m.69687 type:complete len:290 (+) Transcript_22493:362-1231(+)